MLSCSCIPPISQRIERSEAIEFFEALRRGESWLVFWSYDTSNGAQQLFKGRITSVNLALLDSEDDQNRMTYVVIAGVEFVRLERDEAPYEISGVADQSYDFVLGFQAGKYGCCVMAKDPRSEGAPPTA